MKLRISKNSLYVDRLLGLTIYVYQDEPTVVMDTIGKWVVSVPRSLDLKGVVLRGITVRGDNEAGV